MSLFKQWQDLIENQTEETFQAFWKEYSETETRIYSGLLKTPNEHMKGKFGDLATKYEANPVIFMGFLDGIQTSLNNPFELENIDENSDIDLDVDLKKLFFNMIGAEADYLYSLPEWDAILTDDEKKEIATAYRRSRTVVKEKEPGRNDPCPCGSGKKYKKCCGANK
ncbi:MAG: SEC-C domain-containing protein [Clostridia bacterium]|nr:SEC-C domain-containing protein [Clostridia bacterium]